MPKNLPLVPAHIPVSHFVLVPPRVLRRIDLFKTKLLSKLKINSVILIHIEYTLYYQAVDIHIRHDHILYPGIDCERREQKICAFFKYFHVKLLIPEEEYGISSGVGF